MALDIDCREDYFACRYRTGNERPRFPRVPGEDRRLGLADQLELEKRLQGKEALYAVVRVAARLRRCGGWTIAICNNTPYNAMYHPIRGRALSEAVPS